MYNASRSPFIHKVKTFSEIEKIYFKNEKSMIFGGGTHIMRYNNGYPSIFSSDIIDISDTKILGNYNRNLNFIEIESNVRISKLIDENLNLPKVISMSLQNGIPYSISKYSTLGGTISPLNIFYDITVSLIALSCMVNIYYEEKGKIVKENILLENLYQKMKENNKKFLLENIQIPRQDNKYISFFKRYSNPYFSPNESVCISGFYNKSINDIQLSNVSLAVGYADKGCYMFQETTREMNTIESQYLYSNGSNKLRNVFISELEKYFGHDERNKYSKNLFDDIIEEIQINIF